MTITASWADLEPGTVVGKEGHEAVLARPADVRELVDTLARPDTSEALLIHASRPMHYSAVLGEHQPDHQVLVAVWHGFGYLEYIGPDNAYQAIGHPSSPEYHTTAQGYFYPGTGVSLDVLVAALTEFLITAERPTGVRWRDLDRE